VKEGGKKLKVCSLASFTFLGGRFDREMIFRGSKMECFSHTKTFPNLEKFP
jgi:hypothetical protein